MTLSPLNQRRFALFKAHKRGWWSLWVFLALFILSLGAELIANDKPSVDPHPYRLSRWSDGTRIEVGAL